MASTTENIQPTRGELLKLERRIELAERGHELLKEKRDALVTEFFDNLDLLRDRREEVREKLGDAFDDLVDAKVVMGSLELEEAADAATRDLDVEVDSRNIMGVNVPVVSTVEVERDSAERGYSLAGTSAQLDEAAGSFEEALGLILELAEVEKTVRLLAREIERTKRRVNSLEHVLIPRLEENREYIEMRLQEQERENYFRLKRVKEKMG